MKERIVIKNSVDVSIMKRHPQWEYSQFLVPDKQYKREQVPETFEELKELCKGIKGNKRDLGGAMWFEFPVLNNSTVWLGKFLCVDEKGQVGIAERSWGEDISITIFSQSRTPEQMWQIIKNLIGEE